MNTSTAPAISSPRDFVARNSIVRTIWGDPDLVLLIFAGSAAEFALNRAVDWLFFTGELPRDPIGRLFSTVRYAQEIVFVDEETARKTLARINARHSSVEKQRGQTIPDWAYRDVLYMLIDYSERSYALLYRPLSDAQRMELFGVFFTHRRSTINSSVAGELCRVESGSERPCTARFELQQTHRNAISPVPPASRMVALPTAA